MTAVYFAIRQVLSLELDVSETNQSAKELIPERYKNIDYSLSYIYVYA